nr:DUF1289 domain-containing protein [uncultured Glaciecola sp.]
MKNENEIKSPCIRNCCLGSEDVCLGCFRSIDEILMWGGASSEDRSLIIEQTVKRRSEKV